MLDDVNEQEVEAAAPEVQQQHQEQQQIQQHEQGTVQQVPTSLLAEVEVEIRVKNITRQGLSVLEKAYAQWAEWQHQTYPQGYPPEQQLLSGSLLLDVAELNTTGRVVWQDAVGPVTGTGKPQAIEAAAYEEVEAPPLYDRGIDELLAPAAVLGRGISMLPGGAEATRRRQMAEARLSLDQCGDTPGAVPPKRKRLSTNRCFNCGSYAHGIAQCSKEYDASRVKAAKAEHGGTIGGNTSLAALLRGRYFQGGGKGSDKPDPFQGIKPGCISAELATAVGMHSQSAPPPWLCRMAALGLPPKWMEDAPAAGLAAEDVIAFVNGSEDEPAEPAEEAEKASESSGDDSSGPADSADADFVPIGEQPKQQPEATKHDACAEQQQQQQQQPSAGTAQNTAVPESNGRVDPNRTLAAAAVAAVAAAAEGSIGSRNALAHFPGINGPLPDGADAEQWRAELDRGFSARHMLGVR